MPGCGRFGGGVDGWVTAARRPTLQQLPTATAHPAKRTCALPSRQACQPCQGSEAAAAAEALKARFELCACACCCRDLSSIARLAYEGHPVAQEGYMGPIPFNPRSLQAPTYPPQPSPGSRRPTSGPSAGPNSSRSRLVLAHGRRPECRGWLTACACDRRCPGCAANYTLRRARVLHLTTPYYAFVAACLLQCTCARQVKPGEESNRQTAGQHDPTNEYAALAEARPAAVARAAAAAESRDARSLE